MLHSHAWGTAMNNATTVNQCPDTMPYNQPPTVLCNQVNIRGESSVNFCLYICNSKLQILVDTHTGMQLYAMVCTTIHRTVAITSNGSTVQKLITCNCEL